MHPPFPRSTPHRPALPQTAPHALTAFLAAGLALVLLPAWAHAATSGISSSALADETVTLSDTLPSAPHEGSPAENQGLPSKKQVLTFLDSGTVPDHLPSDFFVKLVSISDLESAEWLDPGVFLPELEDARLGAQPLLAKLRKLVDSNPILTAALDGRSIDRVLGLFKIDDRNYTLLVDNV